MDRRTQSGSPINSVRFWPDGFTIATAATNGSVQLWKAASGKKLGSAITAVRMKWTDCAGAIRFSDSGKFVYFITAEGKFWEWKMPSAIQGDAEAILNYAELSAHLKLDNTGKPVLLSPAEIQDRSDRVGSFTPS